MGDTPRPPTIPCRTKPFVANNHLSPLLTYSIFAAMKPNKIQVMVMVVMVVMVVTGKVVTVVTGKGGANMGMNANHGGKKDSKFGHLVITF